MRGMGLLVGLIFRRYDMALYYEDAHNDYLQFAAETGGIGLGLLGLALGTCMK